MHQKCPHCHEETFSWRDLVILSSFTPVQCENCHDWVRNSGWRQLLAPLVIISITLAALPLLEFIPSDKAVFLIPVAVVVLPMVLVLLAKPVPAENLQLDRSPFTPDPNNDKAILIRGWNEDELHQILDDFVEEDLTGFAAFRIEIAERTEDLFELTFPDDIHPTEFLSLINYLAHPIDFVLHGRSIVVAGKTTLNSDFDGLPKALAGKRSILYLPEHDEDHEVVYLQTESGITLAKSFDETAWRKVKEPRLPSAVESLIW
jgi:hypothetical protein